MSCGISPAFAGVSPIGGQVAHVFLTRAPCAGPLYCYRRLRTRLACVKHAASVRSEPGSNSRLKLVVLKSKNPAKRPGVISERTFENIARLTHKPNGFWHVSFSCQRTGFLSGRKATADSNSVTPHSNLSRRKDSRPGDFPQRGIALNARAANTDVQGSPPRLFEFRPSRGGDCLTRDIIRSSIIGRAGEAGKQPCLAARILV